MRRSGRRSLVRLTVVGLVSTAVLWVGAPVAGASPPVPPEAPTVEFDYKGPCLFGDTPAVVGPQSTVLPKICPQAIVCPVTGGVPVLCNGRSRVCAIDDRLPVLCGE